MGPQNPIRKETGITYIPMSIKARKIGVWVSFNARRSGQITSCEKGLDTPPGVWVLSSGHIPIWFWCPILKVQVGRIPF